MAYLLITEVKDRVVGTNTTWIHFKIPYSKGLIRLYQGSGNEVLTYFTAHGECMNVKVNPFTSSEEVDAFIDEITK